MAQPLSIAHRANTFFPLERETGLVLHRRITFDAETPKPVLARPRGTGALSNVKRLVKGWRQGVSPILIVAFVRASSTQRRQTEERRKKEETKRNIKGKVDKAGSKSTKSIRVSSLLFASFVTNACFLSRKKKLPLGGSFCQKPSFLSRRAESIAVLRLITSLRFFVIISDRRQRLPPLKIVVRRFVKIY